MRSIFLHSFEQRLGREDPSRTFFEYHYHGEHPSQQSKFFSLPVLAVIYVAIIQVMRPELSE